jgi:hypothetical protein
MEGVNLVKVAYVVTRAREIGYSGAGDRVFGRGRADI